MLTDTGRPGPAGTYRVQLTAQFGLDRLAGIAPYLASLGVSHVYCSPILQARPGSTSGYDVVSHRQVNRELGGEEALTRLSQALADQGLGLLLDIVPNHMAVTGGENLLWLDLLENGPLSRYAEFFDVDWHSPEPKLTGKVLAPLLAAPLGDVLDAGQLYLGRDGARFALHYMDHALPISPPSLAPLLAMAASQCGSDTLGFLADAMSHLPTQPDEETLAVRRRDQAVLRRLLERLFQREPALTEAVDELVRQINSDKARLLRLIDQQYYRLAFWRSAGSELNYRRFFEINSLVGLCIESEQVFQECHQRILAWVRNGQAAGLRIDHIDGLRDPQGYLDRLRQAAPDAWLLVEKIIEPGERLPPSWPVAGTTGYDFLNQVGGLFVDPAGQEPLTAFYAAFSAQTTDYADLVHQKKLKVLRESFGGEVNRLTAMLVDISQRDPHYRDFSRHELHEALRELLACLPVYRTYIREHAGEVSPEDRQILSDALQAASRYRPDLPGGLWNLLRDVLLLHLAGREEMDFILRFQQLTGPAMAKGAEDTAFYCFNRLISLNEVGGDPGRFGASAEAFHQHCLAMQQHWPRTMLTTTTHDTKRGEDARLRISLLSEMPDRWMQAVQRWSAMNDKHRTAGEPDRNIEYYLYQTLVGAWPLGLERLTGGIIKAANEAKTHTAWIFPNPPYAEALTQFVQRVYNSSDFTRDLDEFVRPLIHPARLSSLSQTLIKCTAPGVPDFYQGSELWDHSLVDPDNRRPVDYDLRTKLLHELDHLSIADICQRYDEGLPKLLVIRRALDLRRRRGELFSPHADYQPLSAAGEKAAHVVAFTRAARVLTVVPRLLWTLAGQWGDTTLPLPAGTWRNQFTGEALAGQPRLADMLGQFPVALLLREE